MSRIVFAGPSLYGVSPPAGLIILPPAAQGDVMAAVESGATHIGIVDGYFGTCASVWHKEILHALAQGCRVLGSSSMGALRASECALFGMESVGVIAAAYCSGELTDDADVALTHGPAEFGFVPFTEPMVELRATLANLETHELISAIEATALSLSARRLHFTERNLEALLAGCDLPEDRQAEIIKQYEVHAVRLKRQDACLLLDKVLQPGSKTQASGWTLNQSSALYRLLARHRHSPTGT